MAPEPAPRSSQGPRVTGEPSRVIWAWARSYPGVDLCVTPRPPCPATPVTPVPSPERAEFTAGGEKRGGGRVGEPFVAVQQREAIDLV